MSVIYLQLSPILKDRKQIRSIENRSFSIQKNPILYLLRSFFSAMNIQCEANYEYIFYDLDKICPEMEDELHPYFQYQNLLYDTLQKSSGSIDLQNKRKFTGTSSFAKIYIDCDVNKLFKLCKTSEYFLEVIQEAFMGYILHSYFPSSFPTIFNMGIHEEEPKKKYIYFSQTYYPYGTYYDRFDELSYENHIDILRQVALKLQSFQKLLHFIHADLKTNNICISYDHRQELTVNFIDLGYSSIQYLSTLVGGDLSLTYEYYMQDDHFHDFCEDRVLNHRDLHRDPFAHCGDIVYFLYTILFHHFHNDESRKKMSQLYHLIHSLFDFEGFNGYVINVFDHMKVLHNSSFDFIGFFMSKNCEMFDFYFAKYGVRGVDFAQRFSPESIISYLDLYAFY